MWGLNLLTCKKYKAYTHWVIYIYSISDQIMKNEIGKFKRQIIHILFFMNNIVKNVS